MKKITIHVSTFFNLFGLMVWKYKLKVLIMVSQDIIEQNHFTIEIFSHQMEFIFISQLKTSSFTP